MALVKPLHSGDPDVSHAATCIRSDFHAYVTRNRFSHNRFPAETRHSQMLYGKDVDGSGQASTKSSFSAPACLRIAVAKED